MKTHYDGSIGKEKFNRMKIEEKPSKFIGFADDVWTDLHCEENDIVPRETHKDSMVDVVKRGMTEECCGDNWTARDVKQALVDVKAIETGIYLENFREEEGI